MMIKFLLSLLLVTAITLSSASRHDDAYHAVASFRPRSTLVSSSTTHHATVLFGSTTTTTTTTRRAVLSLRGGRRAPKVTPVVPKEAPISLSTTTKKTPPPIVVSETGATMAEEVFNLVKTIMGVGCLSLPAGIAVFGNAPSAIIPAVILIAVIGILSANGFAIIGKVCAYTGATSYRDAWAKSVDESSSWIPAWSTTLKTFLACLAISMVLADTFSSLLRTSQRTQVLLGVTTFVLLPLCWMKQLASLAPFSLLGVIGMAYTALAMAVRYFDQSYLLPEGKLVRPLLDDEAYSQLLPSFGSKGWKSVFSPNSLVLVCMLSTAYMAHFNAPKFYLELKRNTLPRFYSVTAMSFGISIVLMGFIASIGFATFGQACSGLILNNYAPNDVLIAASRVAVAVSLVFSYPLAFQGCRDGILDVMSVPRDKRTNAVLNTTTVALLGLLTALAATLTDVSFVLAFGGATLGNALTFVYPAIMYYGAVKKQGRDERVGVTVASLSAVLGIVMGAIGTKMALEK